MKSYTKRILLSALAVAALGGGVAQGKECKGVNFPDQAQVDVNGAVKGTIKGDDFAKAFLAIWLGGDPPNPEIKAGMLGGACG